MEQRSCAYMRSLYMTGIAFQNNGKRINSSRSGLKNNRSSSNSYPYKKIKFLLDITHTNKFLLDLVIAQKRNNNT